MLDYRKAGYEVDVPIVANHCQPLPIAAICRTVAQSDFIR
jgi:hypothetical protein